MISNAFPFLPALAVSLAAVCATASAAEVTLALSGTGASGALNLINFDNEINEPNAFPPSREYVNPANGNSSSHGFPYFQYKYDDSNPDAFNNYANEFYQEDSFWSIIVSSHTVAGEDYWQKLLTKAGAKVYANLTTNTTVLHPDPGAFNLGTLRYDPAGLSGVGLEVIPASAVTLAVNRSDYNFNVLNEPTTPGSWVGYPYYYWAIDMQYTLSVRNLTGPGLLFSNGVLVGIELKAIAELKNPAGVVWGGTLHLTEQGFTYDINQARYVSGFGDLHIIMDRSGPITLPGVVPEAAGTARLEIAGTNNTLRIQGWPSRGYRIQSSTDAVTWTPYSTVTTNAAGHASVSLTPIPPGQPTLFYRAARLAAGETLPP